MPVPLIRVLMVDDDEEEFVIVSRHLKKATAAEYTVEWVDSFEKAVQAFRDDKYDVYLLDYNLGERTGIDLLRAMREAGSNRPVILLTGQGNIDVDMLAMELGAFDYLEKSAVAAPVLERSIRYAIENYRVREQLREANEALEQRVQQRTAELNRSNTQLQRFAEIVASDLQQPLQALRQYITSVERTEPLSIDAVFLAIRNMELLVHLVLNYARTREQRTPFVPIALESVVREIHDEFRARFEDIGVTLTTGALPVIRGDQRLIKGLFENLIDNALKYRGPHPPHIDISAELRGHLWLCQVTDNGVGVPGEECHEVFLMFARGTQCGDVPGVGIGLALCRKIVEYHGGRIWLDPGKMEGTTVSLSLPALEEEDQGGPTPCPQAVQLG